MDYGSVVERAYNISWKYKSLWVFGAFASFFGGSGHFFTQEHQARASEFIEQHPILLAVIVLYAICLAIFLLIMHLIGTAALIDGVLKIERGEVYRFKDSLRAGLRHFKRFLGLWLVALAAFLVGLIILAIPTAIAFLISVILGFLILLVVIPASMVILFGYTNLYALAQRGIVVEGKNIADAIFDAFLLLISHFKENIVVFIINIAIGIILYLINTLLVLVFVLPLIFSTELTVLGIVLMMIIEVPIFVAIAVLITGFFGTFLSSVFTIFYLDLRKLDSAATVAGPATAAPPNASY